MKDVKSNLDTDENLNRILDVVKDEMLIHPRSWYPRLRRHLDVVSKANVAELNDRAFLERLWDDDTISSTGMGSVKVAPALNDPSFREWFSAAYCAPLPTTSIQAEIHLTKLYNELEKRLREKCDRVARLKLNRVLCARFPDYFTTIADVGKLLYLHRAMGGSSRDHAITAHRAIKRRIDDALGPVDTSVPDADLDRLFVPWFIYEHLTREDEEAPSGKIFSLEGSSTSTSVPQPAALRRKGLSAVRGYFSTTLELVQLLADGMTRQEFADEILRMQPGLGQAGINGVINSVAREFNLCIFDGATYKLNARGLNLLASGDPDEVADHLLTRILGIDYAIKRLEATALPLVELIKLFKQANPGWNTDYMPRSMISWLSSLDLISQDSARTCSLTERGRAWASKITWTPEVLTALTVGVQTAPPLQQIHFSAPVFSTVVDHLAQVNQEKLNFPEHLVRRLHVGLWSHPVRHFAVLTGISGSGKTQLALNYARAITLPGDDASGRVRVIPVQPAWYDPTPLLGYVSPLTQRYCTAPFLETLLRAADDPERSYVVILDEMNLSHPEQYLAPMLSAMETRGWIDLHDLPDDATDIPQKIQYPANLAIIGTLNMDETTHGLSDKILDRAFTLEFWDIDVADFPGWDRFGLPPEIRDRCRKLLIDLGKALAPVRLHFGWRTVEDVLRYLKCALDSGSDAAEATDAVIYARVLPKLRGENSTRFRHALASTQQLLNEHGLKQCASKVASLHSDLDETGTARFWR